MNRNSIFIILPIFITTIVLMTLNACNPDSKEQKEETIELSNDPENYYRNVQEYTYEDCEYISVGVGNSRWGSHKGNCSNPIHKGQHPPVYELEIETKDYIAPDEKHFDCYVNSIEQDPRDKKIYWVETECGILFQSEKSYKVGDVLKNFKSEKHK